MAETIQCACGKTLRIRPDWAGKKVRCPVCQNIVEVSAEVVAADAPPSVPAPAADAPLRLMPMGGESESGANAPGPCPNCASSLQPGAVLCTQCGYDLHTRQVRTFAPTMDVDVKEPVDDIADEPDGDRVSFMQQVWLALEGKKRWIAVALFIAAGAYVIWYALEQVAKPDSGPYELVFTRLGAPADGEVQLLHLHIFWHNKMLPNEPALQRSYAQDLVDRWYIMLPDGQRERARWKASRYKNAVDLEFTVPAATLIRIGLGENHEAEFETPAGDGVQKLMLRYHE